MSIHNNSIFMHSFLWLVYRISMISPTENFDGFWVLRSIKLLIIHGHCILRSAAGGIDDFKGWKHAFLLANSILFCYHISVKKIFFLNYSAYNFAWGNGCKSFYTAALKCRTMDCNQFCISDIGIQARWYAGFS